MMYRKYPRTPHIPESPGMTSDDIEFSLHPAILAWDDMIITEKMDGENTTLYRQGFHSRSVNYRYNHTRDIISVYHSMIKDRIPVGWRVCGENVSYEHSIRYENLEHFFFGFSVWNKENICLNWTDTLDFFNDVGIIPVRILTDNVKSGPMAAIQRAINWACYNPENREGFVIRNSDQFSYENFHLNVAKWVRKNHVTTDDHWLANATRNGFNIKECLEMDY